MGRAPKNSPSLTFLEFFAGAGLARLGLQHRWECQWANDICPRKREIYEANFPDSKFVLGDLADIPTQDLPLATMAWASFPCQDLSLAGGRIGLSGINSGAFWPFWNHLFSLTKVGRQPAIVVLENVTGLISSKSFPIICQSLTTLDYRVGALVVDAVDFLPQSRPRVFFVAVQSDIDVRGLTADPSQETKWFPKRLMEAASILPSEVRDSWVWWRLPVPPPPSVSLGAIIERNSSNVTWRTDEETDRLLAMMDDRHKDRVSSHSARSEPTYGFAYRRMRGSVQRAEVRFDGKAGCLRTPRGGSSRQTIIEARRAAVRTRLLTPREAANLMGVPKSYILGASPTQAYRAMADGVAVPVVKWLCDNLLTCLAERASGTDCRRVLPSRVQTEVFEVAFDSWLDQRSQDTDEAKASLQGKYSLA